MLHLFAGLDLHTGLLLLLALAFVLFYEAINGFHDTANAVATVIYTRAMRSQLAVAMAALFNFFGVLLGGLSVAYAIVHMLPTDLLLNMGSAHGLAMVFSMLLAAIIWYLKIYDNGHYCTFPHAIEFLCQPLEKIFPILSSYPELENYLSPFMDAWKSNAQDQLQGQVASVKIPLSRMISPQLYWVLTGNDFTLDINNPEEPKILCMGNNPDRQSIYGAALGLYNSRLIRLINKKGKLKSSLIIDELPTIYIRGLDNLIATARSNKVSVCLGFQDFSQLERDYGEKEAKVITNTVGNIFSGQVVGDTARTLSERFGKIVQLRESHSVSNENVTTSTNTQVETLIPAS